MNKTATPITLSKDRDYLGRDYWTVSITTKDGTWDDCADTRALAVKVAAPLLAHEAGVKAWYITEAEE